MCFDSYKPEKHKNELFEYTQPSSRRYKKVISWLDCRCNVETSMRPPFLCVSSSGFVGIFSLALFASVCLCYLFLWPRFNFFLLLAIKIYVSMWKELKTPSETNTSVNQISRAFNSHNRL